VVDKVGRQARAPTTPTTYRLKATGDDGAIVEKTITVKPAKVEFVNVVATLQGDTVMATFEVNNAVSAECTGTATWQLPHTPDGAETDQEYFMPYVLKTSSTRLQCQYPLSGRGRGGISIIICDIDWRFQGIDPNDVAKGSQNRR
jgi:hypothetical protein